MKRILKATEKCKNHFKERILETYGFVIDDIEAEDTLDGMELVFSSRIFKKGDRIAILNEYLDKEITNLVVLDICGKRCEYERPEYGNDDAFARAERDAMKYLGADDGDTE